MRAAGKRLRAATATAKRARGRAGGRAGIGPRPPLPALRAAREGACARGGAQRKLIALEAKLIDKGCGRALERKAPSARARRAKGARGARRARRLVTLQVAARASRERDADPARVRDPRADAREGEAR